MDYQLGVNTAILGALTIISRILIGPNNLPISRVQDKAEYDFIVVGSGSAGSVVAARLSEVADWRVLVLEAGGQPPPQSRIPGMSLYAMSDGSPWSWNYKTTPQNYSQFNYENNANLYPRGKVIGGTSTINFMMYNRGNRRDYDRWAALGNPGWDYKTVLEYFKKSENYKGKLTHENAPFHGSGGPLTVESKRYGTPVMNAFLEAGKELGYPSIDNNAASQIGFNTPDVTIKDGLRVSAAEAFLRPNLDRSNLQLLPDAHVMQILFDGNLRAIGVRYKHANQVKEVFARREVIVSAGAIDSPKLLMLSGVGPMAHLKEKGIQTLVDLPGVGQNFQDHPSIWGLTWTVRRGGASSIQRTLNAAARNEFVTRRKGPLSSPIGMEGNAWVRLQDNSDPEFPDMQFLMGSLTLGVDYGFFLSPAAGFKRSVYREYYQPIAGREGFTIGPCLTVPKSRGSVTLRSNNAMDPPNIDPNFLSNRDDVELFLKGMKFALSIGNTRVMRDTLRAKFHELSLPGCRHLLRGSDDYWRCYIRNMASTTYHPVGTCKMAPTEDPMGVVSNSLKVRGVTGLRVIDASIMPLITTGNTNAPSIMIGERGADFIKADYGQI